jgi:hypothetical protein
LLFVKVHSIGILKVPGFVNVSLKLGHEKVTVNDGAGPVETTKDTVDPEATEAPAAGDSETTNPAAKVALDAVVTEPSTRPTPVIAELAAACVRPTTFGTAGIVGG